MRCLIWITATLTLSAVVGPGAVRPASAQHETAADLLDGERAYQASCANCHGANGDLVPGIDFGRGQFRRPMTDEELAGIIRNGIPNTPTASTRRDGRTA